MNAKRRILFVCKGNVDCSPAAEYLFQNIEGVEVKSAGTSTVATVPLSTELTKWAEEMCVMEFKRQQAVLEMVPST